jgi:hypothetical protein
LKKTELVNFSKFGLFEEAFSSCGSESVTYVTKFQESCHSGETS